MTRKPTDQTDSEPLVWGSFVALALTWGSSFVFIKIALDAGMGPITLVTWRLAIASVFLLAVLAVRGGRVPDAPGAWRRLTTLALLNVAIPFLLIAWGAQWIPSALSSILNSLVPLCTIVIAAFVLHDEPVTLNRLAGLLLGFGGAALLASPNLGSGPEQAGFQALLGEVAVALGSLAYAMGAVYARHSITGRSLVVDPRTGPRPPTPVEIALPQNAIAGVMCLVLALVFERPVGGVIGVPPDGAAWFAVLWLGVLGSGLAYLFFFRIVRAWGATRTTVVTYVIPIVGITLGVLILGDQLQAIELVGAGLILGGVFLVNASIGGKVLFGKRAPTAD